MNANPIVLFVCALFITAAALSAEPQQDDTKPAAREFGLAVGKKMPFHVVDFYTGQGNCGCPSVMISNGKTRGIIVWTRSEEDAAFRLAQALDCTAVDGDRSRGFVVGFDGAAAGLKAKAGELKHVVMGKSRRAAHEEFARRGIDKEIQVLVFFLDHKDINAMWSLAADELTAKKISEITKQAEEFVEGS